MNIPKNIKKSFSKQIDWSDCGVACLLSILKYYGGYQHIETLREQSGTGQQGTSLLGLYNSAKLNGFDVGAFEADIENLKKISEPCILHIVLDNRMQHFVVCYGYDGGFFLIGDPQVGFSKYSISDIEEKWKSKRLLKLVPNSNFKKSDNIGKIKKLWFLNLLKDDISLLVIVAIIGLLATILGYTMALFSQQLIDNILPDSNIPKLVAGVILVTILQLMRSVLTYVRSTFLNIQSRNFNVRLIDTFYSSLLYLPKTFFNNRKVGELVARMDDTSRIQSILAFVFGDLSRDILIVLVSFVIIFVYSSFVGLLTFFILPLYFVIAFSFHSKIVQHQREVMVLNAKKTSNYINTLENIDAIKSYRKEENFSLVNKLVYGVFQDKIFSLGKISISMKFITDALTVVFFSAIISLCSMLVIYEHLTIGQLAALFTIIGTVLPSIGNIAFSNIRLQGAKIAFDRMYEFACITPESTQKFDNNFSARSVNRLVLENISFSFPGRSQLLFDINLTIEKGKIVSLMGESGSGKTTLLNLILRFYKSDAGNLLLDQYTAEEISLPTWRKCISVVPQEISIFNNTLVENICLSNNQDDIMKAIEFCKFSGFDKYFSCFSQSYFTLLGEEGISISGGQKQLIGIARALFFEPEFLLLDEPTSSLDKNSERFVLDLLNSIKHKTGIFVITHIAHIARNTDYIHILKNGKISCHGTHNELIKFDNFYCNSLSNSS